MENNYTFITIHTLVNIGDGNTPLINSEGDITTAANLSRIVDTILRYSYPFMTTVSSSIVDLSKSKNASYYRIKATVNNPQMIYTFKFAVKSDSSISTSLQQSLNSVPVVISNNDISRFVTIGDNNNTTIIENKII